MTDDEKLQKQLNSPKLPKALEAKIRENWKLQIDKSRGPQNQLQKSILAFSAVCALVLVFWQAFIPGTSLADAAFKDIQSDAKKNVGISLALESILKDYKIHDLPKNTRIKMTKQCTINNSQTVHIRLIDANSNEVHLFILADHVQLKAWHTGKGRISNMSWKLIKPRSDLAVLLFHSEKISNESVTSIIRQMFAA